MVFLENLKSELEALRPIISELHDVYDIERSQERIAELHEKAAEPNFWDDMEKSQKVLQETRNLEGKLENTINSSRHLRISKCLLKWQPMRVTRT